jgi:hypothetical protein
LHDAAGVPDDQDLDLWWIWRGFFVLEVPELVLSAVCLCAFLMWGIEIDAPRPAAFVLDTAVAQSW